MDNLTNLIVEYCHDTENADKNYELAKAYHALGHTAAALSFYLRAAERTQNKLLAYECMINVGVCFEVQGNRTNSVRGAYKHAICILPERPEAYYYLSRTNERTSWWIESYMYAEMGLNFAKFEGLEPLRGELEYPGKYGLVFEKAVSSWWWGKIEECKSLFLELKYNYELDEKHLTSVNSNIARLNIDETKHKVFNYSTSKDNSELVTVVIQGKYTKHTNDVIRSYLEMPFIGDVIISCWEEDPVETFSSRVKFVRNKKPFSSGTDNRNLQIVSSLAGVKKSKTRTSVKVRSDQIFTKESLQSMYDFYNANKTPNAFFVNGLYPSLLFHPCDHIFWGETEDLINLFDIPLEFNGLIDKIRVDKNNLYKYYEHYIRSETYIGAHYCARFNDQINMMLLQPQNYLYDNSKYWKDAYDLSNKLTKSYFKSFPKGLEMYWASKGINYPYEEQQKVYNQRWID